MEYQEIIDLEWSLMGKKQPASSRFSFDDYIMVVYFGYLDDFSLVLIKLKSDAPFNIWENSETVFYGMIKTEDDLKNIMRYIGIVEY